MADRSGKKPRAANRPKPDRYIAIDAAAKRVHVEYADLLRWMLENVVVSAGMWTQWMYGDKDVGDEHLLRFVLEGLERERKEKPPETRSAVRR